MATIFISHSSSDNQFINQLCDFLRVVGHTPLLDLSIRIGDEVIEEIEKKIRISDFFVLVLTPASVNSEWVANEWKIKYWQETKSRSRLIFPIMLETCDVPELLSSRLYADCTENILEGLTLLLKRLNSVKLGSYEDHNSAQADLISILKQNKASGDSKAYFFQYSALEVRSVLKQAVRSGYQSVVFTQNPETINDNERQTLRIEVGLNDIRQMVNSNGFIEVRQVNPPITAKLIYIPNLFVALSYYIYLDASAAPPPGNNQDIPQMENKPLSGRYDVSGHDNPVIIIQPGEDGWKYWSDFAEQLNERYLECSQLIYPSS